MLTPPSQAYAEQVASQKIAANPAQQAIVAQFDPIFYFLVKPRHFFQRLIDKFHKPKIQGMYLWGSVGVGKTMMMDLFYNHLPIKQKKRTHLHSFLLDIHAELKNKKFTDNPLQKIADDIAKSFRIIFFDEFYVKDVADAMLLGDLIKALLQKNIILIASTNVAPDDLYEKGLQRDRFLPTIDLIKQYCQVIELTLSYDYRRQFESYSDSYFIPHNKTTEKKLNDFFKQYASEHVEKNSCINIHGRDIHYIKKSEGHCIWLDCVTLCTIPRAAQDYFILAKLYPQLILANIPCFTERQQDLALNFIKLIDVLYEQHTTVIISAAADPDHLYQDGPLKFEFERCQSRLIEMQTSQYRNRK